MRFFTYIVYSRTLDGYYVGHCQDLDKRLRRHNSGNGATYTKRAKDWVLKWSKPHSSRAEASKDERAIKRKKSRKYIEFLISGG